MLVCWTANSSMRSVNCHRASEGERGEMERVTGSNCDWLANFTCKSEIVWSWATNCAFSSAHSRREASKSVLSLVIFMKPAASVSSTAAQATQNFVVLACFHLLSGRDGHKPVFAVLAP